MSQKVKIYKNTNRKSTAYNKYFAKAVYDNHFVETDQLAEYIQNRASVTRADCKAVLDELGTAMKHFFELGQKIKLDKVGIFKVGLSSKGTFDVAGATAALAEKARVLFQPETESVFKESVSVTRAVMVDGTPTEVQSTMPVYTHPATMLKDIRFELAYGGGYQEPTAEPEP
jgi:predicted histone-like DNA-binding protein